MNQENLALLDLQGKRLVQVSTFPYILSPFHSFFVEFMNETILLGFSVTTTCYSNECLVNNGNCDHYCIDTYDSYYCACKRGYQVVNTLFDCPGKSSDLGIEP